MKQATEKKGRDGEGREKRGGMKKDVKGVDIGKERNKERKSDREK